MRCPVAVRRGVIEQDTAISAKSRNEFPSASPGKNIVEDNDVLAMVRMSRLASKGWPNRRSLTDAVGLIFEVGCAKERGPLVNQRILRLKIYDCSVRRQQD